MGISLELIVFKAKPFGVIIEIRIFNKVTGIDSLRFILYADDIPNNDTGWLVCTGGDIILALETAVNISFALAGPFWMAICANEKKIFLLLRVESDKCFISGLLRKIRWICSFVFFCSVFNIFTFWPRTILFACSTLAVFIGHFLQAVVVGCPLSFYSEIVSYRQTVIIFFADWCCICQF